MPALKIVLLVAFGFTLGRGNYLEAFLIFLLTVLAIVRIVWEDR